MKDAVIYMRIEQELKDKLQSDADEEQRSLSNHVIWIIKKYYSEREGGKKK